MPKLLIVHIWHVCRWLVATLSSSLPPPPLSHLFSSLYLTPSLFLSPSSSLTPLTLSLSPSSPPPPLPPVSRWSCDEGVTWTRYTFTTTPMRLIGILAQMGEKARRLTYVYILHCTPETGMASTLSSSDSLTNSLIY